MTTGHAQLVVHANRPSSKLCTIRTRCTLRPRHANTVHRPIPTLRKTNTVYPTATFAVAGSEGDGFPSTDTDRFDVLDFHHVEFWCADAASAAGRFSFGLGVPLAAQSVITTGNSVHASHVLRSRTGSLTFLFSAPYARHCTAAAAAAAATATVPSFSADGARRFTSDYGVAVRALAVRVADAAEAFWASVNAGARPAFAPAELSHGFVMAEVELFGDTVLRFVSYPDGTKVSFLPGFEDVASSGSPDFGLTRFDHIAGAVPDLASVASYVAGFTGFHEFSDFTGHKVGTGESALNGVVLANNEDTVLLTLLEPVHGTKRRSQVQTFLDHHGGPGVQHLAMASDDLLGTLREIRARSSLGGFELLPPPPPRYYDGLRQLAGDVLSEEQIKECQELGVLVDRDDHGGVVLQVFTKAANLAFGVYPKDTVRGEPAGIQERWIRDGAPSRGAWAQPSGSCAAIKLWCSRPWERPTGLYDVSSVVASLALPWAG
ncbi:4-hydroxyphenylpyruvate dioxygenase-like [Lolium perenne]|uniref:4-hydroxyphenylpyruvate dioxygenase-like n=1 Tax=Lolium perenne TaxID=4522 RepID=UPI0021F59BDF|nr:4-hydroxyphenylpyruvate dioxygenase-like [Lolium perenne]